MAEWFKAVSLSLIRLYSSHIRSNRIFSEECSLIGKIGSFNLQILGSSPSTLVIILVLNKLRIRAGVGRHLVWGGR